MMSFENFVRTFSETKASPVVFPLILIDQVVSFAGSAVTVVWTPRSRLTPEPLDPFFRGSLGWSHIWNRPVRCPGANAEADAIANRVRGVA